MGQLDLDQQAPAWMVGQAQGAAMAMNDVAGNAQSQAVAGLTLMVDGQPKIRFKHPVAHV